tara:strand:+ start:247 stop:738 length:492 start_codon:yes stop_codon:yes gene_type:complete
MNKNKRNIKSIILDFDGVLTNNMVYVGEDGNESVRCNRSDGLVINILKKCGINFLILSTESNKVVRVRAKKLKIDCYNNIKNKQKKIIELNDKKIISLSSCLYIGNDINDYKCIKMFKFSACPKDSHPDIKKVVKWILSKKGGEGILHEVAEKILKIKLINYF